MSERLSPTEPSFTSRLSRVERYQFEDVRDLDPDFYDPLAREAAAIPAFHRKLIENPYTEEAIEKLREVFPDFDSDDSIGGLILSEPDGEYERQYAAMSWTEKRQALYTQIDSSSDMIVRITERVQNDPQKFWEMSDAEIFSTLSQTAFGTTDVEEIEAQFSRSQRRGFRLSIMNFIDDRRELHPFKDEFDADPKKMIKEIFEIDLQHDVSVESLPIGFIISLHNKDFTRYILKNNALNDRVRGIMVLGSDLPEPLMGRIVLINENAKEENHDKGEYSFEELRTHELQHIVYRNYFQDTENISLPNTEELLRGHTQLSEFQDSAGRLRKQFSDRARDEVLAYATMGFAPPFELFALGGHHWRKYLKKVATYLEQDPSLSSDEKTTIYKQFHTEYRTYIDKTSEYQFIARSLLDKSRKESDVEELSRAKVLALIGITNPDRMHRLESYTGQNPQEVTIASQEEKKKHIRALSGYQSHNPFKLFSRAKEFDKAFPYLFSSYPIEALHGIVDLLVLHRKELNPRLMSDAIEEILFLNQHTLSREEIAHVKNTLQKHILDRRWKVSPELKERVSSIVTAIDEVYAKGGIDFSPKEPTVPIDNLAHPEWRK